MSDFAMRQNAQLARLSWLESSGTLHSPLNPKPETKTLNPKP
jgi:hypothetical protein